MERYSEVLIERILLDNDVISDALERATKFFKVGILPELVGKWFSKARSFTAMQLPEEVPQIQLMIYGAIAGVVNLER